MFKYPSGVISCTSNLSELKKADYVIDVSTSDNIDDKRKNFQVLDEMCDSKAIIAINLGTSNIDQIVGNSSRAHNVIGTSTYCDQFKIVCVSICLCLCACLCLSLCLSSCLFVWMSVCVASAYHFISFYSCFVCTGLSFYDFRYHYQ